MAINWELSDTFADAAVLNIEQTGWKKGVSQVVRMIESRSPDSNALPSLQQYAEKMYSIPNWVNFERLANGSKAYFSVGTVNLNIALGAGVLIRSFTNLRFATVLSLSQGWSELPLHRVRDTGRWLFIATQHSNLMPGGAGLTATAIIRLLHARSRRAICLMQEWHSMHLGTPISQADLLYMCLLLSIGYIESLSCLGVAIHDNDAKDILHLWRYIAYLLGVEDTIVLSNYSQARECFFQIEDAVKKPTNAEKKLKEDLVAAVVGYTNKRIHIDPLILYQMTNALIVVAQGFQRDNTARNSIILPKPLKLLFYRNRIAYNIVYSLPIVKNWVQQSTLKNQIKYFLGKDHL
jgi:hypothetical protein